MYMAGADADLQHHRRIGGFRQREPFLDRLHQAFEIGPWVKQPDLRFHGKGMGPLLHDRGALAIVLADDDERSPGHSAGSQIGEGIGCHIGADRRFPGDRPANGIIDRGRQHGRGGRFRGRAHELHAQLVEHVARVRQHVHQMRNGCALVAADIGHTRLQQRLGDGENAFAAEQLTFAEPQVVHFAAKLRSAMAVARGLQDCAGRLSAHRSRRTAPW